LITTYNRPTSVSRRSLYNVLYTTSATLKLQIMRLKYTISCYRTKYQTRAPGQRRLLPRQIRSGSGVRII